MAEIQESGRLRAVFAQEFQSFIATLPGLGLGELQVTTGERREGDKAGEMLVTIEHPTDRSYNLTITVDSEELVTCFGEFHNHYETHSQAEERPPDILVAEAINWIRLLVTADQIVITRRLKGQVVYRKTLEAIFLDNKQVLENIYMGCRGLLFFLPTEKTVAITSFR